MHTKIYLDDVRPCPDGWHLARSVEDAKHIVKAADMAGTFEVSCDHDLGEDESGRELPNGCAFLAFLLANDYVPTSITLHSSNPVGLKNMRYYVWDILGKGV